MRSDVEFIVCVSVTGVDHRWLDHSAWNGLTVADLLFPWFMWMMGVSLALAFKARASQKQTRTQLLAKVIQRSFKLVALGLFLNNGYDLNSWRFPGVLQYFGFSYLWVGLAVILTGSWDGEPAKNAAESLADPEGKERHDWAD